jgi:MFS family permease
MAVMIGAISATAAVLTAAGRRIDKLALLRVAPFVHAGQFVIFLFWHTELWQAYVAVAIGGVGAGILSAWLPAAAANAAPPGQTATLVGLISLFQVVGVALGSAAFAVVLGTVGQSSGSAAALSGYLTVFAIAIASSVVAGIVLQAARRAVGPAALAELATTAELAGPTNPTTPISPTGPTGPTGPMAPASPIGSASLAAPTSHTAPVAPAETHVQ